jgi:hypothetical protein
MLLSAAPRSWFILARRTTAQYGLPDPLLVLQTPPTKGRWKALCRSRVTDYWEQHLRGAAAHLDSLANFKSNFFSVSRPHNTFRSAGSPYEVARATVVCLMLSGRYQTDYRRRLWDPINPTGACRLCSAPAEQGDQLDQPGGHPAPPRGQLAIAGPAQAQRASVGSQAAPPDRPGAPEAPPGDLVHQLLHCPALAPARGRARQCWAMHLASRPHLVPLVNSFTLDNPVATICFLLDPSSSPGTIALARDYGESVFSDCHYLSRVWCYANHRARLRTLKLRGFM